MNIDGAQHDEEPYKSNDATIRDAMTMFGMSYFVLRFDDAWDEKLEEFRSLLLAGAAKDR